MFRAMVQKIHEEFFLSINDVHIWYLMKGGFVERGFRIGTVANGAFGLTVTSIGDIDQDGFNGLYSLLSYFNMAFWYIFSTIAQLIIVILYILYFVLLDVAIGAPFDGKNKTGVVYIYRGDGNLGLKQSFSQVRISSIIQMDTLITPAYIKILLCIFKLWRQLMLHLLIIWS